MLRQLADAKDFAVQSAAWRGVLAAVLWCASCGRDSGVAPPHAVPATACVDMVAAVDAATETKDAIGASTGPTKAKTCAEQGLAVDCATTWECHVWGHCTFDPSGQHVPSGGCYCRAATDQACEQSFKCQHFHACRAHNGVCQATTKDQPCTPTTPAYCGESGLCGDYLGMCFRPTEAGCATSEDCMLRGQCHACPLSGICPDPLAPFPGARCWAATDADCAQSAGCLWRGECEMAAKALQRGGSGRACAAHSQAACAASLGCKYKGLCKLGGDGDCKISDESCAKSMACEESGQCGTLDGYPYCVPTAPAHCATAQDCKRFGQCSLDAVAHVCRK